MDLLLRDIKARIDKIRGDKNLKQSDFADSIGFSQSGYATLLTRDGSSKRLKTLCLAIEAVYGVRHEWLMSGNEPIFKGTEKHLDPLQKIQNEILASQGISTELKAESFRLMVSNEAQGVLLGLMMRNLAQSRRIKERGAPNELLNEMESNRKEANEIFNQFETKVEEACNRLNPVEQIILVCEIFVVLKKFKLSPLHSIRDKVSKGNITTELRLLIEMIDKIKNLTRSTKKVKEWENKPLVDIESHSIDSEKGWTRKVFSGGNDEA